MVGGKAIMKKTLFAASIACSVLLTSCADMFQERVAMQQASNNINLATMFNAAKEIEKLDTPSQIFVSNGQYSNQIVINWKEVSGARSYSLERAEAVKDENGKWKVPDEGDYDFLEHSNFIDGTTYTDTIIDGSPSNELKYSNEAYERAFFYRVCAKNALDKYEDSLYIYSGGHLEKEKYESGEKKAYEIAEPSILLAPPTNITASCGEYEDKIEIKWTKAEGSISNYKIYRGESDDVNENNGTLLKTLYGSDVSYTVPVEANQKGKEFYFTIVSVGASGRESVGSSVALGYALKGGAPARVTDVEITSGRGDTKDKISLKWKALSGSDIKYRVYRYSSIDSSLKALKDGITGNTYDDNKGVKTNIFYYYKVQAYTGSGDSEVKGPLSEEIAEGYLLSPPKSVTVQRKDDDITTNTIFFSAAIGSQPCTTNSDATKEKEDWKTYTYNVYGSEDSGSSWVDITDTLQNLTLSSEGGMYQADVEDHKIYKVSTVNGSLESDCSEAVAPAPRKATNLKVSKNGWIAGYTNDDNKANANGVHAIKLTWSAPVGGADGGYHVYRSTKPDGGFKKVTDSPVTDTTWIYLDEQAKAGNLYYYRVLSLNSLSKGANYSDSDFGYGALTTYQYVREYIKSTLNSQKKLTLMHKSAATDKLGSDNSNGDISGNLSYNASMQGLGGRVIMHYTNYADYYVMSDKTLSTGIFKDENNQYDLNQNVPSFWKKWDNDEGAGYIYFLLNGNTNTTANISSNGTMDGTVTVDGMYPGSVVYDAIQIKGGAAGGGTYGVTRNFVKDDGNFEKITVQADWTWGEK